MIADRFEILRSAIAAALSAGLSSGVIDDSLCLVWAAAVNAAFTVVATQLRTHYLNNYTNLLNTAVRSMTCEMVNHDFR